MSAVRNLKREEWVWAAVQLIHRSNEHVGCPECGASSLRVRDVEYGFGPRKGLDRYLFCSQCGCHNLVNMRHAGASSISV